MLFGQIEKNIKLLSGICLVMLAVACKNDKKPGYTSFVAPGSGERVSIGTEFTARLQFGAGVKPDSIIYFLDTTRIVSKTDTSALQIPTSRLKMGSHLLTAKVYEGAAASDEVTTNFIVLAAKAPEEFSYKVINTFPHDTDSYTEGLEYHNGFLYESSAGQYVEESSLRRVDLTSGKVVQKASIDKQYFAEGMTVVADKIIQLTYKERVGFVYDKATFKKLAEFPYPSDREGWGLSFDGEKILNSDGSNTIYYLDKNTYRTIGMLEVYDHNGPVDSINELEYINGKIYANVYDVSGPYANKILIIDPLSGAVEGCINLIGLNPEKDNLGNADYILNGIAWDATGKRLFVTGKKWSKLFEIQPVKN